MGPSDSGLYFPGFIPPFSRRNRVLSISTALFFFLSTNHDDYTDDDANPACERDGISIAKAKYRKFLLHSPLHSPLPPKLSLTDPVHQYHPSNPTISKNHTSKAIINTPSIPTISAITTTTGPRHQNHYHQKHYTHIPTAASTSFRTTTTAFQPEWSLPPHLESSSHHHRRRSSHQRDLEARIAAEAILYGTLGRWCDESSDTSDSKVHHRKETLLRRQREREREREQQIVRINSAALRAPFEIRSGGEEMIMGEKMTPSSNMTTRGSLIGVRERPDWTERDECSTRGSTTVGSSMSMKAGLNGILPMLKKHMSVAQLRRRSCGSEDVTPEEGELEEVGNRIRIVREEGDAASVVMDQGRFQWSCVRFGQR